MSQYVIIVNMAKVDMRIEAPDPGPCNGIVQLAGNSPRHALERAEKFTGGRAIAVLTEREWQIANGRIAEGYVAIYNQQDGDDG